MIDFRGGLSSYKEKLDWNKINYSRKPSESRAEKVVLEKHREGAIRKADDNLLHK